MVQVLSCPVEMACREPDRDMELMEVTSREKELVQVRATCRGLKVEGRLVGDCEL